MMHSGLLCRVLAGYWRLRSATTAVAVQSCGHGEALLFRRCQQPRAASWSAARVWPRPSGMAFFGRIDRMVWLPLQQRVRTAMSRSWHQCHSLVGWADRMCTWSCGAVFDHKPIGHMNGAMRITGDFGIVRDQQRS